MALNAGTDMDMVSDGFVGTYRKINKRRKKFLQGDG